MKDSAGNEAVEVTRTVVVQAKASLDPFGKAEVKPYVPVTLYGKVRIGEVAASEGDVVAVWVGDEMRGKVQIQFVVGGVAYLTLPIYAEQDGEKTNRFKLWDQSSGEVYELGKVMELSIGGTIGSAEELVELDFGGGGDEVAPVIELLGEAEVTVELGSEYEDAGAKATDGVDGDLSGSIVVQSNVDTAQVGSYRVSYNVKDSAGNEAVEVVRDVLVDPFGVPVVYANKWATVLGQVIVNGASAGEGDVVGIYVGDELRGKLRVQFIGGNAWLSNARVQSAGIEETVRFKLYDNSIGVIVEKSGSSASIEPGKVVGTFGDPFFIHMDSKAPIIELLGEAQVTVELGSEYEDEGVKATDVVEGDLSGSIVVVNNVDTARPGTYRVSYNVQDSAGNAAAEVVRVVVVKPRLVETLSLDVVQRKPFTFRFTTQIGVLYKVEVSEDLQKWIKVKEIKGTDGIVQFTDDRSINESAQFYRLRMQ